MFSLTATLTGAPYETVTVEAAVPVEGDADGSAGMALDVREARLDANGRGTVTFTSLTAATDE